MTEPVSANRWLVLLYQFPAGRDSRRVKVWRRLQSVGAVAIKNSVYVLPNNEQSQEDFEWLLTELRASGADGVILESRLVGGMGDKQVQGLFDVARKAEYEELREQIESDIAALPPDDDSGGAGAPEDARRALARARKRLAEIEAIDFFGADGHNAAEAGMRRLAERTTRRGTGRENEEEPMQSGALQDLTRRIWVTRRGVRVDRIASAWLIRRWIDSDARFKFVAGKGDQPGYSPADGEVRFDMFDAEFTHQGDMCTFEVLARRVRPDDAALRRIGEIVHDIDLKDAKFGRPETEGIATLIAGIVAGTDDDEQRIERGAMLLEDLYRGFEGVAA